MGVFIYFNCLLFFRLNLYLGNFIAKKHITFSRLVKLSLLKSRLLKERCVEFEIVLNLGLCWTWDCIGVDIVQNLRYFNSSKGKINFGVWEIVELEECPTLQKKKNYPIDVETNDWHKRCKSYRKDDIIGDAEQIQLTNMRACAVELRARGEELHCIGEHICQLDLRVIADYRSLPIGVATLDNLRCWQDNHLHTIE